MLKSSISEGFAAIAVKSLTRDRHLLGTGKRRRRTPTKKNLVRLSKT
jgi:hypothetical protein